MRAHENGAGAPTSSPRIKTADALRALYHVPIVAEAAAALVTIDEAGLLQELRDSLAAEWRAFKADPDRKWRYDSPVGLIQTYGRELARLTCGPCDECIAAVASIVDPQWTQVACAEIVDFAKRLQSQNVQQPSHDYRPLRRKVVA
jgi:hypothetical protein